MQSPLVKIRRVCDTLDCHASTSCAHGDVFSYIATDVLCEILSYLAARDVLRLSLTCRALRYAAVIRPLGCFSCSIEQIKDLVATCRGQRQTTTTNALAAHFACASSLAAAFNPYVPGGDNAHNLFAADSLCLLTDTLPLSSRALSKFCAAAAHPLPPPLQPPVATTGTIIIASGMQSHHKTRSLLACSQEHIAALEGERPRFNIDLLVDVNPSAASEKVLASRRAWVYQSEARDLKKMLTKNRPRDNLLIDGSAKNRNFHFDGPTLAGLGALDAGLSSLCLFVSASSRGALDETASTTASAETTKPLITALALSALQVALLQRTTLVLVSVHWYEQGLKLAHIIRQDPRAATLKIAMCQCDASSAMNRNVDLDGVLA
ncbi:Fbox domain containing protein [Acanthamoeba castellanii str. Neff]|uniref:Fbox domain containing protein n=1 Tax=Acanthamoeba castellanii (strain ATCC 30010 / Neff) TaxID=1257118 RepID=L8GFP3_ACACF|nr:Fbox domain containing protein [Acanthamoeba castellanii str. Neff]ELR11822.1 Fbox domain containing protein [Acanthamoeba castellanii str. Neff]